MNSRLKDCVLDNSVLSNTIVLEQRIYSDESCLEKITSKQYKSIISCEEPRTRNRSEMQKSLIKRMK